MYITTNMPQRNVQRGDAGGTSPIWHGGFDLQFGKGATLLIGRIIRRNTIGLPIPPGEAAGIARLDANTDFGGGNIGCVMVPLVSLT